MSRASVGHEWMGIVTDVGAEVRTIKRGDRVIAPYDFCDGTCEFCGKGLDSACVQGGLWGFGHEGGQAEAIRVRFADATLVAVPPAVAGDEDILKSLLPLTDVMAAGHHAAVSAGVRFGTAVVVIGDGAVGLCGVLAAHRLGAEHIIIAGHQPQRLALARQFGATEIVTNSGDEVSARIIELKPPFPIRPAGGGIGDGFILSQEQQLAFRWPVIDALAACLDRVKRCCLRIARALGHGAPRRSAADGRAARRACRMCRHDIYIMAGRQSGG